MKRKLNFSRSTKKKRKEKYLILKNVAVKWPKKSNLGETAMYVRIVRSMIYILYSVYSIPKPNQEIKNIIHPHA